MLRDEGRTEKLAASKKPNARSLNVVGLYLEEFLIRKKEKLGISCNVNVS